MVDKRFFESVREAGTLCWFCGNHNKGDLHVHHVDFNKENNVPLNLLVTCNRCHGKLHSLFQRMGLQNRSYVQADLDKKNEKMIKDGLLCLNQVLRTGFE